ncbi:MAG TPA: cupin domain-containing protein [Gaiellales bacterium]|jgi:hypothetical protein
MTADDRPRAGAGLHDVLSATLGAPAPWPPGADPPSGASAASLELSDDGTVRTGIWECTPGSFASARDGYCELMHFAAGDATIVDERDGTRHAIGPGSILFVPDGWRGRWEIRATVRKSYAMFQTPPTG